MLLLLSAPFRVFFIDKKIILCQTADLKFRFDKISSPQSDFDKIFVGNHASTLRRVLFEGFFQLSPGWSIGPIDLDWTLM